MDSNKSGNTSSEEKSKSSSLKERSSRGSGKSLRERSSRGSGSSLKERSSRSSGSSLKERSSRKSGSSLKDRSSRTNTTEKSSLSSRRSSSGSSRRRKSRKKKKNQIPYGVIAVVIAVIIGLLLSTVSINSALFWVIGLSFGVVLQRGRFCFTASMRDPYLTGSTSITRAVLIAFGLTTIGFTAIKYGYHIKGLPVPGMGYVVPISIATVIGAFIFGIGMVIAGGCASGTLMRLGEGFQMQIISLTFFVIGSLWGAHDFGWWKVNIISKGNSIFLPDVFGWMGGLVVQLTLITALYFIAEKYEVKRLGK